MRNLLLPDYSINLFKRPERYIVIYGGRGSGKTMAVAINIVLYCLGNPNTDVIIVREFKKTGEDGCLKTVFNVARTIAPRRVRMTRVPATVYFDNGSNVNVLGSERNADGLRDTLNNVDLVWAEESHTLSENSFDIMRPSVRKDGAKLLFTYNPRYPEDIVSKRFQTEPMEGAYIVKVNYLDYPDLRNEALDIERAADLERGHANFSHIWLGDYVTETGAMFDTSKIRRMNYADFLMENDGYEQRTVRAWDIAATEGAGDYTVGIKLTRSNGIYFITDIIRGQWGAGQVEYVITDTMKGDGKQVHHSFPLDPGAGGTLIADRYAKIAAGLGVTLHTMRPSGSKVNRAEPVAAAIQNGLFASDPTYPWLSSFVSELVTFGPQTIGRFHDDQVDAVADAFNLLSELPDSDTFELYDLATYLPDDEYNEV